MAYQMAPTEVILNDLKVVQRLQGFSGAIPRPFMQHFTSSQLTVCSCCPSVIAGLLMQSVGVFRSGRCIRAGFVMASMNLIG